MTGTLPWRASGPNRAARPIDPDRLPVFRRARPRKRWSYLGVYGAEVQLCVGVAAIAGATQSFWAVHHRASNTFRERSVLRRAVDLAEGSASFAGSDVRAYLTFAPDGDVVEVVSDHGGNAIWTRKTPVRVSGEVRIGELRIPVDSGGLVDDSAGHHARITRWSWSAGCGTTADGAPVVWNLVDGVHDSPTSSERTVWVGGTAREVDPVTFAEDLSWLFAGGHRLTFTPEAERARHERLLIIDSRYRQPFGAFTGTLPDGTVLDQGFGVMERHDVRW